MEAFLLFWLARVLLVLLPFRTLAKRFGPVLPPSSCRTCPLTDSEAERVRRIGWAVTRIGNHTPLVGTCLPQALAASSMLLWRGLRGSLHIGVRLAGAGSPLEAHAWVHSGEVSLTGFPVAPDFQEIACIAIRQPK